MTRRGLFSLAVAACLAVGLYAETGSEGDDDVFQSPPPDTQAPSARQSAQPSLVDQFTTQTGITFHGSFETYSGFLIGWAERPDMGNLSNGFSMSPAFGLACRLTFEARPNASFRVLGTLSAEFPDTTSGTVSYAGLAAPGFSELFCDYSVADLMFLRIGKQAINWGAARFYPIDNLPARVPDTSSGESYDNSAGIALKINVPLGVHALTGVMQMKDGYFQNSTDPSLEEVGFGLISDWVIGSADISLGGYYEEHIAPRALAIAKTTLWGVDARAGSIISYHSTSGVLVSWLANAYWEQPDTRFHVAVEYIYNAEQSQPYTASSSAGGSAVDSVQFYGIGNEPGYPTGHALAALAGFRSIFGSKIDVGIQWKHVFSDNSGVVIPAVQIVPFDCAKIAIGFPFYYGSTSSAIMDLNPDTTKRQTSFGLKLSISSSF